MEYMQEKNIEEKLDLIIDLLSKTTRQNYDFDGACEYLCCKDSYLRSQIKAGKIRYKKKGRDYLFRREWLDDWMEVGDEN